MSVVLTGFDDVKARLNGLAKKDANAILRQSLREGAKVILPVLQADTPAQTDTLRHSWRIRSGKRSRRGPSVNIVSGYGEGAIAKAKQYYGYFVNYGHFLGKRSKLVKKGQALIRKPWLRHRLLGAALLATDTRTKFVAGRKFVQSAMIQAGQVAANIVRGNVIKRLDAYWREKSFARSLGVDE